MASNLGPHSLNWDTIGLHHHSPPINAIQIISPFNIQETKVEIWKSFIEAEMALVEGYFHLADELFSDVLEKENENSQLLMSTALNNRGCTQSVLNNHEKAHELLWYAKELGETGLLEKNNCFIIKTNLTLSLMNLEKYNEAEVIISELYEELNEHEIVEGDTIVRPCDPGKKLQEGGYASSGQQSGFWSSFLNLFFHDEKKADKKHSMRIELSTMATVTVTYARVLSKLEKHEKAVEILKGLLVLVEPKYGTDSSLMVTIRSLLIINLTQTNSLSEAYNVYLLLRPEISLINRRINDRRFQPSLFVLVQDVVKAMVCIGEQSLASTLLDKSLYICEDIYGVDNSLTQGLVKTARECIHLVGHDLQEVQAMPALYHNVVDFVLCITEPFLERKCRESNSRSIEWSSDNSCQVSSVLNKAFSTAIIIVTSMDEKIAQDAIDEHLQLLKNGLLTPSGDVSNIIFLCVLMEACLVIKASSSVVLIANTLTDLLAYMKNTSKNKTETAIEIYKDFYGEVSFYVNYKEVSIHGKQTRLCTMVTSGHQIKENAADVDAKAKNPWVKETSGRQIEENFADTDTDPKVEKIWLKDAIGNQMEDDVRGADIKEKKPWFRVTQLNDYAEQLTSSDGGKIIVVGQPGFGYPSLMELSQLRKFDECVFNRICLNHFLAKNVLVEVMLMHLVIFPVLIPSIDLLRACFPPPIQASCQAGSVTEFYCHEYQRHLTFAAKTAPALLAAALHHKLMHQMIAEEVQKSTKGSVFYLADGGVLTSTVQDDALILNLKLLQESDAGTSDAIFVEIASICDEVINSCSEFFDMTPLNIEESWNKLDSGSSECVDSVDIVEDKLSQALQRNVQLMAENDYLQSKVIDVTHECEELRDSVTMLQTKLISSIHTEPEDVKETPRNDSRAEKQDDPDSPLCSHAYEQTRSLSRDAYIDDPERLRMLGELEFKHEKSKREVQKYISVPQEIAYFKKRNASQQAQHMEGNTSRSTPKPYVKPSSSGYNESGVYKAPTATPREKYSSLIGKSDVHKGPTPIPRKKYSHLGESDDHSAPTSVPRKKHLALGKQSMDSATGSTNVDTLQSSTYPQHGVHLLYDEDIGPSKPVGSQEELSYRTSRAKPDGVASASIVSATNTSIFEDVVSDSSGYGLIADYSSSRSGYVHDNHGDDGRIGAFGCGDATLQIPYGGGYNLISDYGSAERVVHDSHVVDSDNSASGCGEADNTTSHQNDGGHRLVVDPVGDKHHDLDRGCVRSGNDYDGNGGNDEEVTSKNHEDEMLVSKPNDGGNVKEGCCDGGGDGEDETFVSKGTNNDNIEESCYDDSDSDDDIDGYCYDTDDDNEVDGDAHLDKTLITQGLPLDSNNSHNDTSPKITVTRISDEISMDPSTDGFPLCSDVTVQPTEPVQHKTDETGVNDAEDDTERSHHNETNTESEMAINSYPPCENFYYQKKKRTMPKESEEEEEEEDDDPSRIREAAEIIWSGVTLAKAAEDSKNKELMEKMNRNVAASAKKDINSTKTKHMQVDLPDVTLPIASQTKLTTKQKSEEEVKASMITKSNQQREKEPTSSHSLFIPWTHKNGESEGSSQEEDYGPEYFYLRTDVESYDEVEEETSMFKKSNQQRGKKPTGSHSLTIPWTHHDENDDNGQEVDFVPDCTHLKTDLESCDEVDGGRIHPWVPTILQYLPEQRDYLSLPVLQRVNKKDVKTATPHRVYHPKMMYHELNTVNENSEDDGDDFFNVYLKQSSSQSSDDERDSPLGLNPEFVSKHTQDSHRISGNSRHVKYSSMPYVPTYTRLGAVDHLTMTSGPLNAAQTSARRSIFDVVSKRSSKRTIMENGDLPNISNGATGNISNWATRNTFNGATEDILNGTMGNISNGATGPPVYDTQTESSSYNYRHFPAHSNQSESIKSSSNSYYGQKYGSLPTLSWTLTATPAKSIHNCDKTISSVVRDDLYLYDSTASAAKNTQNGDETISKQIQGNLYSYDSAAKSDQNGAETIFRYTFHDDLHSHGSTSMDSSINSEEFASCTSEPEDEFILSPTSSSSSSEPITAVAIGSRSVSLNTTSLISGTTASERDPGKLTKSGLHSSTGKLQTLDTEGTTESGPAQRDSGMENGVSSSTSKSQILILEPDDCDSQTSNEQGTLHEDGNASSCANLSEASNSASIYKRTNEIERSSSLTSKERISSDDLNASTVHNETVGSSLKIPLRLSCEPSAQSEDSEATSGQVSQRKTTPNIQELYNTLDESRESTQTSKPEASSIAVGKTMAYSTDDKPLRSSESSKDKETKSILLNKAQTSSVQEKKLERFCSQADDFKSSSLEPEITSTLLAKDQTTSSQVDKLQAYPNQTANSKACPDNEVVRLYHVIESIQHGAFISLPPNPEVSSNQWNTSKALASLPNTPQLGPVNDSKTVAKTTSNICPSLQTSSEPEKAISSSEVSMPRVTASCGAAAASSGTELSLTVPEHSSEGSVASCECGESFTVPVCAPEDLVTSTNTSCKRDLSLNTARLHSPEDVMPSSSILFERGQSLSTSRSSPEDSMPSSSISSDNNLSSSSPTRSLDNPMSSSSEGAAMMSAAAADPLIDEAANDSEIKSLEETVNRYTETFSSLVGESLYEIDHHLRQKVKADRERKREKEKEEIKKMMEKKKEKQTSDDSPVPRPAFLPVQESDDAKVSCAHFKRGCETLFPCCKKFYQCHRCHNSSKLCNKTDSKASDATHLRCRTCLTTQEITPTSSHCSHCKRKLSEYFCGICKHFTADDKKPYHCKPCGICRVHRDNSFHCDVCNVCLNKKLEGKHKCRPDSGHDECCICLEDAFGGCQVLPCTHKVHRECAVLMVKNGVRKCPVCRAPIYQD